MEQLHFSSCYPLNPTPLYDTTMGVMTRHPFHSRTSLPQFSSPRASKISSGSFCDLLLIKVTLITCFHIFLKFQARFCTAWYSTQLYFASFCSQPNRKPCKWEDAVLLHDLLFKSLKLPTFHLNICNHMQAAWCSVCRRARISPH